MSAFMESLPPEAVATTSLESLNSSVDFEKVTRLKLATNGKKKHPLYVLYFLGPLCFGRSQRLILLNVWFYTSEHKRTSSVEAILREHTHISL